MNLDDGWQIAGEWCRFKGFRAKTKYFFILFISLLITFLVDRKHNYDSAASHVTTTTNNNNNWPCWPTMMDDGWQSANGVSLYYFFLYSYNIVYFRYHYDCYNTRQMDRWTGGQHHTTNPTNKLQWLIGGSCYPMLPHSTTNKSLWLVGGYSFPYHTFSQHLQPPMCHGNTLVGIPPGATVS